MSDRSAIDPEVGSGRFRRHIGRRVVFVPPAAGRRESGVVIRVDERMVYVDYGYPNPVWPHLGNAIATHPSNLRLDSATTDSPPPVAAPIFSHASAR